MRVGVPCGSRSSDNSAKSIDFLVNPRGKIGQNTPLSCNLSATRCSRIAGLNAPRRPETIPRSRHLSLATGHRRIAYDQLSTYDDPQACVGLNRRPPRPRPHRRYASHSTPLGSIKSPPMASHKPQETAKFITQDNNLQWRRIAAMILTVQILAPLSLRRSASRPASSTSASARQFRSAAGGEPQDR
jgi:hypothetical protein